MKILCMKSLVTTLFLLTVLMISSCKKNSSVEVPAPEPPPEENVPDPVARFTVTNVVDQVLEGVTLNIENQSQNAVSYLWDFGDGTTSTEKTPTFNFITHGGYDIKLTVKNKKGVTSEYTYNRIGVICRGRTA